MKLGFLIVTYNRLEKLIDAIQHYDEQLTQEDSLYVVDNGSDEYTQRYLKDWISQIRKYKKIVIRIDNNIGATYGFKKGLQRAVDDEMDWIHISDDDAFPSVNYVENLRRIIMNSNSGIGAVCSKITYPNGNVQYCHRRFLTKGAFRVNENNSLLSDYENTEFDLNLFSFVGVAIKIEAIKCIGLPDERFYIWYDDTEYSYRISKKYRIKCYSELVFIHDCGNNGANGKVSYKEYYGYRNRLIMLKNHFKRRYVNYYLMVLRLRCISNWFKCRKRVEIINDSIKDFKRNVTGTNSSYLPSSFKEE